MDTGNDNLTAQKILEEYKEEERKKMSAKMSALAKIRFANMTLEERKKLGTKAINIRWKKRRKKKP